MAYNPIRSSKACHCPSSCSPLAPSPLFQCHTCRRQTSLTAGTLIGSTKLPLTKWFLAIYLVSQGKTWGLSAPMAPAWPPAARKARSRH